MLTPGHDPLVSGKTLFLCRYRVYPISTDRNDDPSQQLPCPSTWHLKPLSDRLSGHYLPPSSAKVFPCFLNRRHREMGWKSLAYTHGLQTGAGKVRVPD